MADAPPQADGTFLLIESHYPTYAATAYSDLCAEDLEIFQSILSNGSNDVEIQRVEHIVARTRRCAYQICFRTEST